MLLLHSETVKNSVTNGLAVCPAPENLMSTLTIGFYFGSQLGLIWVYHDLRKVKDKRHLAQHAVAFLMRASTSYSSVIISYSFDRSELASGSILTLPCSHVAAKAPPFTRLMVPPKCAIFFRQHIDQIKCFDT